MVYRKAYRVDYPTIQTMRSFPTRQLVLLIILSALCIGIQLTPRPPNVEFTSLIVFLVGAIFGISFGATLGTLVMFINGFFSPWGFAGLMLPFQVAGALFSAIHIVSNTAVFGLIFFPLTNALQKFLGGEKTWEKGSLLT